MDIVALLSLAGATLCWGSIPVMLKYLTVSTDGFTANAVRYPLSAVVYLPWLVVGIRRGGLGWFWLTALIPTAVNVAGQTLWAWAPYYLEAGIMAFLFRMSAVFGIVGAFWLFPDERPLARSGWFWIGTALAVAGFTVMATIGLQYGSGTTTTGVVIILLCSLCYGAYAVSVRYVMGNWHPLIVFSVICAYTSIPLLAMAPLGHPSSLLHLSVTPLVILIVSGFVGVAAAHGLYYVAVQRMGVAVTSLTLTATPFVSIIGSSIWLGEEFTAGLWLAGIVLAAGTSLAVWSQQRLPVPPKDERLGETAGQP